MILFEQDWQFYPNAIADDKTSNKSFLEFAQLLKKMGVKNHLFHLSLHQPELQGVDPFDPDITPQQKEMIAVECRWNFWYFLREICRFPANTGVNHNRVRANRAIIALSWLLLNNINTYLMQPRQTGKSVGADAFTTWIVMFRCENNLHTLITKDNKLLMKNIKRLKQMRDILPEYLWVPTKGDTDNQMSFNYARKNNEVLALAAQVDPEAANKMGRGITTATLHMDEHPFIRYIQKAMPAAVAGMNAARKEAVEKGEPNFILTTTTAGMLNTPEGRYSFDYYSSGAPWIENYYDCRGYEDLINVIKLNRAGERILVSATFTHRMLGMSDKEHWENINQALSTPDDIDRDFFLVWTTGGESSVLDSGILGAIQGSEREPDHYELTTTGYVIKWYIPEDQIEEFMATQDVIIAADTSEQVGRDATAFILRSTQSVATIATMSIDNSNIITAANWLCDFMTKYPRTTLVMERKSTAITFIDSLILVFMSNRLNPFRRIYNTVIQEPEKYPDLNRQLKNGMTPSDAIIDKYRKNFGFNQTGKTRDFLYSTVLKTAAKQSQHVVYDKTLGGQLRGLTIRNNRVDHSLSGNDDSVMAWLLGHWFMMFGKDLGYYGIDTRKVLLNVSDEGKQFDERDLVDNERIDAITNEIEQLESEMAVERHGGLRARMQRQIDRLNLELERYGVEARTTDAIVQEVKETNYYRPVQRGGYADRYRVY